MGILERTKIGMGSAFAPALSFFRAPSRSASLSIGIYFLIPLHFLRTVGANDDSLISVPDAQGITRAVATFDAMAHAAVNQKQQPVENGAKAMQNLLAVKSLDKAIEVQSEYAKTAYEDYTAQVTKLGQLYSELAKETFKPYEGFALNR
jgi:hypothetical protein